jgi:hypothetical protein
MHSRGKTKNPFFFEIGFYSVRLSFYPLTLALSPAYRQAGAGGRGVAWKEPVLTYQKYSERSNFSYGLYQTLPLIAIESFPLFFKLQSIREL